MAESAQFEPEVNQLAPQPVALVRGRVALTEIGGFIGSAFETVAAAARGAGVELAGPPLCAYHSIEHGIADVGAGFPVSRPLEANGIESSELPGGRAVQTTHIGHYDELGPVYERLMDWMQEHGLRPGPLAWESYLNEPGPDAFHTAITLITWPVDD